MLKENTCLTAHFGSTRESLLYHEYLVLIVLLAFKPRISAEAAGFGLRDFQDKRDCADCT